MFSLGQWTLPPISLSNEKPDYLLVIAPGDNAGPQQGGTDLVAWALRPLLSSQRPPARLRLGWSCFYGRVTVGIREELYHFSALKPSFCEPCKRVPPLVSNNRESDLCTLQKTMTNSVGFFFLIKHFLFILESRRCGQRQNFLLNSLTFVSSKISKSC